MTEESGINTMPAHARIYAHARSGWIRLLGMAAPFILGRQPHATLFSFNYFNRLHANDYFRRLAKRLERNDYVVVDIGAGSSPYFDYLRGHIAEYIAIDSKNSLPAVETRPIRQLEGVAEFVPMPDSSADIVVSNQVLEHVLDVDKAVQEVYRVLKPGGTFVGSVPHISPVHLEPYDFRRFTDLGVTQILEKHGFQRVEVEGNCGVFGAAAMMIGMDLVLSRRISDRSQEFSMTAAMLLFPLIGAMNAAALALDFVYGDKNRSHANLFWKAVKAER
jgi:SAM-dependent methyltransferase